MFNKQRIIVTPGEPAGIGPDLIIMLVQEVWPVELIICADPGLLKARAQQLQLPLQIYPYQSNRSPSLKPAGEVVVLAMTTSTTVTAGKLNADNSQYVIATLIRACDGCLNGEFDALVTGPVHKGIINYTGFRFTGHTEFFAERSGCKRVVMMLVSDTLRVALVTTHLPLLEVPQTITRQILYEVIIILIQKLRQYFGIPKPKVYVSGLNPHAGECGYIGREEIDVIIPVLNMLCAEGYDLIGPLPVDTLFQPKYLQYADAILVMYHDQGLPVLKYQSFGRAVNITLGLPFIRTSVDHGTALEVAGTGMAEVGSLKAAINLAINMINIYDQ